MNLLPSGPSFSGENVDRYWTPGPSKLPSVTENKADVSVLLSRIRKYAPHLERSRIYDSGWWEENWGSPEIHVRPPSKRSI